MESRTIDHSESHARRTRSGVLEPAVQPLAATLSVCNHGDAFLARRGGCHPNRWRVIAAVLLGLCVFWWTGCSSKKAESQGMPPGYSVPVTTATATLKTVPIQVHAIGNVEAQSTVSVKAQVAARVEKAYFTEGQDVRKGDLLFTLDRRPSDTALQQAEANLAKDQALLENAKAEAERYTKLFQEGIVSKEQYDSMRTNADALAASVRADKAAIENSVYSIKGEDLHMIGTAEQSLLAMHTSAAFNEKYSYLVPYLMFVKPVLYKGRAYSWGKSRVHLLIGAALLAVAIPFFPVVLALGLFRLFLRGDYPPTLANLDRAIKNFSRAIAAA